MNRFSQSGSAPALTSRIRSERDIIATCVHLLGYWPRNSLVLMVMDAQGIGPLIRVDTADPSDVSLDDYLEISFGSIPRCRGDEQHRDRRVFVLLFGEQVGNYSDAPLGKHTQPVIESDQVLLDLARYYMGSLGVVSSRYDVEILDVIVVGHCTYWSLEPEEDTLAPVGWVSEVFSSPVYAELVVRGSVVSGSSHEAYGAKKWNPLESSDLKATERWLMLSEAAANSYLTRKRSLNPLEPFQSEAELRLWDKVLEAVNDLLESEAVGENDFSCRGDHLRRLIPPDAAGYLVASLNNSATLYYVVYLACSGINQTLRALNLLGQHISYFLSVAEQNSYRLLPEVETLSMFGLEDLNPLWSECQNRNEEHDERAGLHFAGMISGALTTAPNWARLEALECLCALFENVASYKPESMFIAAQAWVRWFWGNSTGAAHILEGADPRYLESPSLLLQSLLDNSAIPLWLTEPGGAPPRS